MLRREVELVTADATREGRECFGGCLTTRPPDTRAALASKYPHKIARRHFIGIQTVFCLRLKLNHRHHDIP